MSLKNKFFSILTLVVATIAFSTIGFAQDKTTTTTDKDKVERKGEGREFGKREGGKREFGSREGFGHHGGPGMRHGGGMMRMMHGLNLTDAQKDQIRTIMEANRPNRENMEAIRPLIQAKRDGTITADQQAQLDSFKTQAREKGRSVHEQIQNVLTAEQKAQIETQKQEMKQKREEFRKQRELRKANPAATTTEKPKDN